MARLADEILRGSKTAPWIDEHPLNFKGASTMVSHDFERTKKVMERVLDYARKVVTYHPVIDVGNVADYMWDQQETWSPTDKDQFPCLTPPFPTFWMEYKRPPFFTHERDDLSDPEQKAKFKNTRIGRTKWVRSSTSGWAIERYGFVFDSVDLHAGQDMSDLPGQMVGEGGSDLSQYIHPDARWILRATLFIKQSDSKVPNGPVAYWFGGLDERGVLLKDAAIGLPGVDLMDNAQKYYWQAMFRPVFAPALRAISYMHCKNIEQQTVAPPPKLSKSYAKKTGRPLLTYRTLVIQPLMKGGRGSGGGGGGAKSHHFRRGHFGDYREKGLFGRENLKRIFWFDVAIVGSKDVGQVIGDYEVRAPDGAA